MQIGRRIAIAGTVLALAVGTTQSATADPRSSASAPRAHPGVARSVTLLTGDRVIVSGSTPEQSTVSVRPAALPLSAVRFAPKLDNDNSARAGRPFLVPVALQLQSGSTVRPARLAVDVSYDEGKTWRQADVLGNLAVLLFHPAGATSVSLRAKATDRDGDTVEQTVIRAYKLR